MKTGGTGSRSGGKTGKSKDGSDKIKAGFNHKQVISQDIDRISLGDNGIFTALREAINNSLDAEADQITIRFGEFEGADALIVSDNGRGFDAAGIKSAMSYAYSSRERRDVKTIGANGTGRLSLLGLGDKEKTKITIFSMNRDVLGCQKMEISFEYLWKMAGKKVKADDYVSKIDLPKDWLADIKNRSTGSTIILTGYDGRTVRGPSQILKSLGNYLTPRALEKINVYEDSAWKFVAPALFKGKPYKISFNDHLKYLGVVDFELYYGQSNIEELAICGKLNKIITFNELLKPVNRDEKSKLSKAWKNVSGHIYIEKANVYRMHDGSLNKEFYQHAQGPLMEILQIVGEELEQKTEEYENSELVEKRTTLLQQIIEANRELNIHDFPSNSAPVAKKPSGKVVDDEYYIVPNLVRLFPRDEKVITLNNLGSKIIERRDIRWSTDSNLFTITPNPNGTVSVKVGEKMGSGKLIADGDFGQHSINVIINTLPVGPHIVGPGALRPGSVYTYTLQRHDNPNVEWEIRCSKPGASISDIGDRKVVLTVPENFPEAEIILAVKVKGSTEDVATKKITITNENGKHSPTLRINGREYKVVMEAYFPDTVAQIDTLDWDKPAKNDSDAPDIPTIVLNPVHPRLKKMGKVAALDYYLTMFAAVALADQVQEGIIRSDNMAPILEEFVGATRTKVLTPDEINVPELNKK